MKLAVVADEIGTTLEEQIKSMKLAKIKYIEMRKVNDKYLWEYSREKLKQFKQMLDENDIEVVTLDSPVGKKPFPYERKMKLFNIYLDISKIFNNKYIRIFSNIGKELDETEIRKNLKRLCESAKKENIYLGIAVVFLILISFMLIKIRKPRITEQKIESGQISSYTEFSTIEAGIYSDLINFASEIKMKGNEEKLPTVKQLEDELIPPFTKDITWEERGRITWERIDREKTTYYVGLCENVMTSGNFIVIVDNKNRENIKILFIKTHLHKDEVEFAIDENFPGWQEIVPYTGENEKQKIEGKGDTE